MEHETSIHRSSNHSSGDTESSNSHAHTHVNSNFLGDAPNTSTSCMCICLQINLIREFKRIPKLFFKAIGVIHRIVEMSPICIITQTKPAKLILAYIIATCHMIASFSFLDKNVAMRAGLNSRFVLFCPHRKFFQSLCIRYPSPFQHLKRFFTTTSSIVPVSQTRKAKLKTANIASHPRETGISVNPVRAFWIRAPPSVRIGFQGGNDSKSLIFCNGNWITQITNI